MIIGQIYGHLGSFYINLPILNYLSKKKTFWNCISQLGELVVIIFIKFRSQTKQAREMKNTYLTGTIKSLINRLLTKDRKKRIKLLDLFNRYMNIGTLHIIDKANYQTLVWYHNIKICLSMQYFVSPNGFLKYAYYENFNFLCLLSNST